MPAFARRLWFLAATGAAYAAFLVVTRGKPSLDADAGVFLSVAGRLLQGDRVYVDVIDNKDPLFYYAYAAALAVGDWRTPFLLDILWLVLAAISTVALNLVVASERVEKVLRCARLGLRVVGVADHRPGELHVASLAGFAVPCAAAAAAGDVARALRRTVERWTRQSPRRGGKRRS